MTQNLLKRRSLVTTNLRHQVHFYRTINQKVISDCKSTVRQRKDLWEESSMQDIPYDTSHVPIDYDNSVNTIKEECSKVSRTDERRERSEQRAALETDVFELQKQLITEMNVRNALDRGYSRPLGSLPRLYADIPVETRNLLLEVAVLEEEIASLEKQVTHLGREIEIEGVPALDKETIWESSTPNPPSPKKVEVVISPLVSPRKSARINSKVTLSSRKLSVVQKINPSKPSFPAGKALENKRSFPTVSVPAHGSSSDSGSSIKPSKSSRDSSEPTHVFSSVPPPKPQMQRLSSVSKATPSKVRELKSRRLSLSSPRKELLEPTGAVHTVPFVPIKRSPPQEDEESIPPESPALVGPGKRCSPPSKMKAGNRGSTPVVANSRIGRKDVINSKVTPKIRTGKARGTSRPTGLNKGSLPPSHVSHLPLASDTILASRTMSSSTATSKPRMTAMKAASASNASTAQMSCDSCLQKPIDAERSDNKNNVDIPSNLSETAGDCKQIHLSHDRVKPPLTACSGSSSQASTSTKFSSASHGNRGGVHIHFRPDDRYTGSFMMMRSASTKYMRDCYSGEVADALRDPSIYLNRENMSNGTGFHQGLMS